MSAHISIFRPPQSLLFSTLKNDDCSLLEKCKSKLQSDITSPWSEWPSPKSLQTINAGEVWRKGNALALLVGMLNDTSTMEDVMEIPLKTRNKSTM